MKKHIVILTGAGISAESGLPTFRDANGLWEGHDILEVASPEGWRKNPQLVQDFYNLRRKAARLAQPNEAHLSLAALEEFFDVTIVTQNVDTLHERAGSKKVIHLHGRLDQSRSSVDPELIYPVIGDTISMTDLCEKGSPLRPNIVWFGEAVPNMEKAKEVIEKADIFILTGTSLQVYPAAGLIDSLPQNADVYVINAEITAQHTIPKATIIQKRATIGVPLLVEQLIDAL